MLLMTDNGSCFIAHAYQQALRELGLRQLRIKPGRPRTNGKAERFIQTLVNEWAYGTGLEAEQPRWELQLDDRHAERERPRGRDALLPRSHVHEPEHCRAGSGCAEAENGRPGCSEALLARRRHVRVARRDEHAVGARAQLPGEPR
jgi:hypothetical protein